MRIDTETRESLQVLAPSKSSSGTSTDNERQAPADVSDPAAGREAVARRLAAIEGDASLHSAQDRLLTARSEAQARQEEMAAPGAAQLVTERTTQQGAIESMERQYDAALDVWTADEQEIEHTVSDLRARHDEILRRSRDELENIAATVCELERHREQLTDNRHAVREVLEGAVRAEREWHAVLADVQTQWQTTLSKALGTGGDASVPTEHALDSSQSRRPLTESPSQNTDDRQLPSDDSATAARANTVRERAVVLKMSHPRASAS